MKKTLLLLIVVSGLYFNAFTQINIINSDFENESNGQVESWTKGAWRWNTQEFKWEQNMGRNNSHCISISIDSSSPNDVWFSQEIDSLEPDSWYQLKGWIKGQNIVTGNNTGASLGICYSFQRSKYINGTFDWTEVTMEFKPNESGVAIIACRLGFLCAVSYGKAWFDDISITKIASRESQYLTYILDNDDLTVISESNLTRWFNHLDSAYLAYHDLTGHYPYGGSKIGIRSVAFYPGGWAIAGNPMQWCKTYIKNEMQHINDNDDWSFGILHEIGHDYDDNSWNFNGEIMANLKMNYVLEKLNGRVRQQNHYYIGTEIDSFYKIHYDIQKAEYLATGDLKGYGAPILHRLMEIQNIIGWEPFKLTFRDLYSIPDLLVKKTPLERYFLFIQKLSEYSQYDVYDLFPQDDMNEFIAVIGGGPVNQIPTLNLGNDTLIALGDTLRLIPVTTDDGYPNSLEYSLRNYDSSVNFLGTTNSSEIYATFSKSGIYTLVVEAKDGYSKAIDNITITVNEKPRINAGNDTIVMINVPITLSSEISDDNIPFNSLSITWSAINNPEMISIADSSAKNPQIIIQAAGTYLLVLTVDDGHLSNSDTLRVTAQTSTDMKMLKDEISDMTVYPNPITNDSRVVFHLNEHSNIYIQLYDNKGRIILNNYDRYFHKGSHILFMKEITAGIQLRQGIYFLVLSSDENRYSEKVIISK